MYSAFPYPCATLECDCCGLSASSAKGWGPGWRTWLGVENYNTWELCGHCCENRTKIVRDFTSLRQATYMIEPD